MTMTKKVLYFEGAGCVPRGEVPNCRIRTAFHTVDGRAIYLELSGVEVTKHTAPRYKGYTNVACVDHCHYITGTADDGSTYHKAERGANFEYSLAEILKFVNSLGGDFDAVEVLPDLAGYRVHAGKGQYNYGDEFPHDAELTAKRLAIHDAIYRLEKTEREIDKGAGTKRFVHGPSSQCYPNFALWVDEDFPEILHLLRHFNGYNKHWTIDATSEDWRESMTEAYLGRYGC